MTRRPAGRPGPRRRTRPTPTRPATTARHPAGCGCGAALGLMSAMVAGGVILTIWQVTS